jgi:hypothetical protein
MSKTADALRANIDKGQTNLIGYFPLGYPTVDESVEVAIEMCKSGIDVLELGIPYSDPVMDGIVIQEATQEALENGFKLSQTFAALKKITSAVETPVLVMSYWNSHGSFYVEGFNPEKQHFILLGDSVFKNDIYVANGKSVDVLLKEKTNGETTTLAVNDSIISDVYYQLDKIPDSLKSRSASVKVYKNTTIFLSVGGNDILAQFDEKNKEFDIKIIDTIFTAYEKLVKTIQAVMPNAIIVLVDIYYPENIKYKKYHLKDHVREQIECIFYDAISFIEEARANNGKVYVHCV